MDYFKRLRRENVGPEGETYCPRKPIITRVPGERWVGDLEGRPQNVQKIEPVRFPALHQTNLGAIPGCSCTECRIKRAKPGSIVEIPAFDPRVLKARSWARKLGRWILEWFGIFILLVTAFFSGYEAGKQAIRNKLTSYHPSQYFAHPGLLEPGEIQRMDNAFEQIRREVSK
jgi:hypothetical protein